jgi:hypothetical protein
LGIFITYRNSTRSWATFFNSTNYALILTKNVGPHFRRFFLNSSGYPAHLVHPVLHMLLLPIIGLIGLGLIRSAPMSDFRRCFLSNKKAHPTAKGSQLESAARPRLLNSAQLKMFGNVRKCLKLFENVRKCSKTVRTCSKLFETVQKCSKMFENVRKCSKMLENVRKCSKMFENVQKCSKMFEQNLKIFEQNSKMFENVRKCSIQHS